MQRFQTSDGENTINALTLKRLEMNNGGITPIGRRVQNRISCLSPSSVWSRPSQRLPGFLCLAAGAEIRQDNMDPEWNQGRRPASLLVGWRVDLIDRWQMAACVRPSLILRRFVAPADRWSVWSVWSVVEMGAEIMCVFGWSPSAEGS